MPFSAEVVSPEEAEIAETEETDEIAAVEAELDQAQAEAEAVMVLGAELPGSNTRISASSRGQRMSLAPGAATRTRSPRSRRGGSS